VNVNTYTQNTQESKNYLALVVAYYCRFIVDELNPLVGIKYLCESPTVGVGIVSYCSCIIILVYCTALVSEIAHG
jgi:hypothetical protein